METHTTKWHVKQISTMIENGTILFDYPIQRSAEQWNHRQKSDLVHSCLIGLPVPPVYFLSYTEQRLNNKNEMKPVNVRQTLDGKQRLTNLYSYYKDGFALLPTYSPISLNDGTVYDVAGKLFSELDEPVQDMFLAHGIPSYTISKELTTDEEIELLFYRMNASKPLTTHQKAKSVIGVRFQTLLNDLCAHSTILELSNFPTSQIRDNKHQAAVLQTMMILENFEYKSFSAQETARYAETIRNDFDNKVITLDKVEQGLNYLNEVFDKKEKFLLKAVSFPMTVALAYECAQKKIEPDMFYLWATAFVDAVNGEVETNIATNYMDYTKQGSTDLKKVRGRIEEMNRHFNAYMELMTAQETV